MTYPPLGDMLATLRESTPLVHCMTNYVAMNSTANLLLATGASPAMLHALLLLAMTPAGRHCLLLGRACMSL